MATDTGVSQLFIDIETIPVQAPQHIAYLSENIKPRANLKDPDKIDADIKAKQAEISSRTALTGLWGEIMSCAWAVDDTAILSTVRDTGQPEGEYLEALGSSIYKTFNGRVRWVGFNVGFDTRFLMQRCVLNQVKWPFHIPADVNPWSDLIFDVQYRWCGRDIKGMSLGALSQAFGLGTKTDAPTMMEYYWKNDQADKIRAYNVQDIHLTRELYKRLENYS